MRFPVVIQTCLAYLATTIAKLRKQTPATKATRGVSRSHVWHGSDGWANWGLTVNNWTRGDKCRAHFAAKVCGGVSFSQVSVYPRSSPATLSPPSPPHPRPPCLTPLDFYSLLLVYSLFLFNSPSLPLSQADSHQPVLVANAELSSCDNILRCSSCHGFIELLK